MLTLGWSQVGRRAHRSATEQGVGESHRCSDALVCLASLAFEMMLESQRVLKRVLQGLNAPAWLPASQKSSLVMTSCPKQCLHLWHFHKT